MCAALLILCMACGSDSPAANSGNTAGSKAGAGGASGSGSGVPCGAGRCKTPEGFTGEVCCRDIFSGSCGEKTMLNDCQPFPPQTAPNCPDGTLVQSVGAMLARGCCVANSNQCGLDLTGFGAYCSPLADADIFLQTAPDAGAATTLIPPPTNCDGTPGM
jgi:hypothetical protein